MEILTTVKEAFTGESEVGRDTASDRERPTSAVESAKETQPAIPHASEADLVAATGRTRAQTLLELVEAHEGRVKQADLVDLTGWSKSTVSRHLGELEREGAIDRVQIGRCKVVLLPDEALAGEHAVSYDTRQ